MKTLLMILDGWGIGDGSQSDAITIANTPYIDSLKKQYPNSKLITGGEKVGLPDGQMGNSEVGHLNIGAGRVIYQDLVRINNEIKSENIKKNTVLTDAFRYAKENNKAVHFLGLISDGGVHSQAKHLYKLCDISLEYGLKNVYIHAITDGRDVDPNSAINDINKLGKHIENSDVKIASLIGRYYTMDRDSRWERIKVGYDLMVNSIGEKSNNILESIQTSYNNNITDEFIKPLVMVNENNEPIAKIEDNDVVICFNYRTDRLREITTVLTQKNMPELDLHTLNLKYLTMTKYDDNFKGLSIIYDKENVKNTLGEVISNNGLKQLRIAETEKYAHVTFFFSGGREKEFEGENRILVSSPKVATYDLQPEMSALLIKDKITEKLAKEDTDFICLNYANGDMVGHTGIKPAILKAIETVDFCVKETVEMAKKHNYEVLIIADHGNADFCENADGSPNTAHSLNAVPCILVSDRFNKINDGILADVAPTLLKMMNIEIPKEMSGNVLI